MLTYATLGYLYLYPVECKHITIFTLYVSPDSRFVPSVCFLNRSGFINGCIVTLYRYTERSHWVLTQLFPGCLMLAPGMDAVKSRGGSKKSMSLVFVLWPSVLIKQSCLVFEHDKDRAPALSTSSQSGRGNYEPNKVKHKQKCSPLRRRSSSAYSKHPLKTSSIHTISL